MVLCFSELKKALKRLKIAFFLNICFKNQFLAILKLFSVKYGSQIWKKLLRCIGTRVWIHGWWSQCDLEKDESDLQNQFFDLKGRFWRQISLLKTGVFLLKCGWISMRVYSIALWLGNLKDETLNCKLTNVHTPKSPQKLNRCLRSDPMLLRAQKAIWRI